MDAAAVVRPHHPLLLRSGQDQPDRLLHLSVVGCRSQPALRRDAERKGEAAAAERAWIGSIAGLNQHGSASATSLITVATVPRSASSVCMACRSLAGTADGIETSRL